jgi:chromosome segregation ATPase
MADQKRIPAAAACLVALLALGGSPAQAQVPRSGGGGGDQRAVQQLQQLAQERTALQAENARLKKDLEQAQADLKAARAERDALRPRLARAEAQAGRDAACVATEQAAQQQRQKLDELVARFRETAGSLRSVETERSALAQQLAERQRALDSCVRANTDLYAIADDTLTRYEQQAPSAHLPFTRLTRTRIENLVDEYRQRAQELRLPAAATGPTASPPAAAEPVPPPSR